MTEQSPLDTPILVFGTTITALGVVRAFARRGQTVLTHTLPGEVVTFSKYYKPLPLPSGFDPEAPATERLELILRSLPMAKAFLLPCSDLWTEAAAALPADLALRFPASIAPRESILILVDKGKLAETMAELGLPHPRSFAVDREEDLAALEDRVFENAFLKPKSSPLFIQKYGVKGMRVHSRAEAAARLRDVKDAGFEVILQEYIPGPPTEHYFIDGFKDVDLHLIAGEASSHCLRFTFEDIFNTLGDEAVKKFMLVTDATSPVPVPCFVKDAEDFVKKYTAIGMKTCTCADLLNSGL